ncbi:MAG TPA: magnesium transporter [Aestuariivirgaceae bacterium]
MVGSNVDSHAAVGALTADFLTAVRESLVAAEVDKLRKLAEGLHPADLADLIEVLEPGERVLLITMLGRSFNGEALAELDEHVRDELLEALPHETIASALRRLDTDDALYLIEDLDRQEQQEILAQVPPEDRRAIDRALDYPEDTAGRLMQAEFVAVPAYWTVGQTTDYMRTQRDLPDKFVEIYVIDEGFHLKGSMPVSRILRHPRSKKIAALVDEVSVVFNVSDSQEDVAYKFKQYNLVSAPVVDENNRLVGALMVDDVVDVIQEEAEEDILHLGGVGDEELSDSVWVIIKSRFAWLFVNLLTALLASWVISIFDATIQQMVALAVLMPIVASMGGNAGTQTMTVVVRALATRELTPLNALKVVWKESAVGLINGLLFAIIVGTFALWWFGSSQLGLVIAAAMVINLIAAALSGILVPLALDRLKIDPAISSAVFVTTVTDVVGFFAFLGLGAIWLL